MQRQDLRLIGCTKCAINAMRNIFALLLITSTSSAFGQYLGYSPINDSDVSQWISKIEAEYYGTYHFGDSEAESTLILFYSGTEIVAQIKSGTWNSDATDWILLFDNLSNVNIDKNGQFKSDQYKGEFVFYTENGERQKCLKIYDSWSGATEKGEYELGWKLTRTAYDMYPGEYPHASTRELNTSELRKMSSDELQLMRNEIFARYGYKFIKGGKMDQFFKNQTWYRPQHSNVNKFLTELEKRNLELIRTEEKRP